ncbi:secreted protein [Moniliophthora roreri]|nr:secreted protein [Moniliophthora roreri]
MFFVKPLVRLGAIASVLAAPVNPEAKFWGRALPTPIAASTARSYLSQLTVKAESNSPAYSRDYFKHWHTVSGTCDTRETVLKRDGTNVVTDSSCKATSGNWVSVYDNVSYTSASDMDIDHIVPLKETRPQLVPVTSSVNSAKGDKDPAEWMPPLASYACTYARAWVQVKYYYKLSVDSAEKDKLSSILNGC